MPKYPDCRKRLKIYFDWEGNVDRPSEYYPRENEIYINPIYYYYEYPPWMWFIPLIHETFHWLISKSPCIWTTANIFHDKLDIFHVWLKGIIFKNQ